MVRVKVFIDDGGRDRLTRRCVLFAFGQFNRSTELSQADLRRLTNIQQSDLSHHVASLVKVRRMRSNSASAMFTSVDIVATVIAIVVVVVVIAVRLLTLSLLFVFALPFAGTTLSRSPTRRRYSPRRAVRRTRCTL